MSNAYSDANYLFKLQCVEHGTAEGRAHAATVHRLCTTAHGRSAHASEPVFGLTGIKVIP
jgi:hypothetical protein